MAHEEHRISGKPRGQTTKKARKRRQPPTLHFVKVAVTRSRAHFPVRDAQQERFIRAHVMHDYLQQKFKSSKPRNASSTVSKLSDHLIQFRTLAKEKQKGSRRGTKEVISDERTSAPTKMRAIMPKDPQSLRDVVSARSLTNSILGNFPSPIKSTPGTSALLEYYHHSFWENSFAVNPEGTWMSVAITDPAVFHATLCRVALHKFQTRGGPQASSYFWHRGEAMRLISQNLADPGQANSDATIGAVAVLSTADNSTHWPSVTQISHIEGMITLLGLRGGVHRMNTSRHIQRVVKWADILHATAHSSLPRLGIAQFAALNERQRLKDVVQQHKYSSMVGQDTVPEYFREILENLQTLAIAKSLLIKKAVSNQWELRSTFSSVLFMTEHSILKLGHTVAFSDSAKKNVTYIEAIKAAALIFTFHGLRDMAITGAFFDGLIRRLRDGLCGVFIDFLQHQNPAYISDKVVAAPLLLWLCLNGWKASVIKTRQTYREFFVEKAAVLCESAKIDTLEELGSHLRGIAFMAEYCMPACSGLWADIKAWTASRDIE